MRLQPKCAGVDGWINSGVAPPIRFVAAAVDLAMMSSAQWYGEFIADLPPERPTLRESQVVGIRWPPAANQARLLG
jgi:hypothetical protein